MSTLRISSQFVLCLPLLLILPQAYLGFNKEFIHLTLSNPILLSIMSRILPVPLSRKLFTS